MYSNYADLINRLKEFQANAAGQNETALLEFEEGLPEVEMTVHLGVYDMQQEMEGISEIIVDTQHRKDVKPSICEIEYEEGEDLIKEVI